VLGNHDYEAGQHEEVTHILNERSIQVLDGQSIVIDGVGFCGTKGFAGGFGRGALAPFGELLIKEFVQASLDEALKIENGLRSLSTDIRVCVLHYSPIFETIVGEPEVIWPFLGSSRLLQPIDTIGCDVVFHGHAHHGTIEGATPSGIPVFNVAMPLLQERGENFLVWTIKAPERRTGRTERMRVGGGTPA
jgi:Icc-related predicted phosphoesterase